jgi:hypothetical protein
LEQAGVRFPGIVQLNYKGMEKIRLIKPLWNGKPNDVLEVSKIRAEFAKRKGYAVEVIEGKAEKKEYKNKAEKAPKKNK